MKATTKDWFNYAKIDLQTCEKILNDEFLTNSVAFHAQQTVEKSFKAIFEEHGLKIPRTHNLLRLHNKLGELINFPIDEDLLEKTDEVYTETRYPGDIGTLADGKPSITEANQLYEFAKYIYENTKKMIENK